MSTILWPPIAATDRRKEEDAAVARELQCLLVALQQTSLPSLHAGLEDCAQLLAPDPPGTTLVLSSLRSEALKGFVTRIGTRLVKAEITLRLPSRPPHRLALSALPTAPTIVLHQLTRARTQVNACLDVVDATRWTGDATDPAFVAGQLRLLHDDVRDARDALQGGDSPSPWHQDAPVPSEAFHPPLPDPLAVHLSVSDAALLLTVRTLEPADPPGTTTLLRERLATAWTGPRPPAHDEAHETFTYNGSAVRVRDKVRVESQDPSLMAAMAKLAALERTVALSRNALDVVMESLAGV